MTVSTDTPTEYAAEPGPTDAEEARNALVRGLYGRIHASILRRTPFLSSKAANEIAEDVTENVAAYLRQVFDV